MKNLSKALKYLTLVGQVFAAIDAAVAGKVDSEIRGIRYEGETWDLKLTGARRSK